MDTSQTPQLKYQKIVGFKIWYSDSVYTSLDGDWENAPSDDVQIVMVYFEMLDGLGRHTRLYSSGCDYYALNKKGEFTSSFDDIKKVNGHVLYGKFMDYEDLKTLGKVAFDDYGEWLDPPKPDISTRSDGHGG